MRFTPRWDPGEKSRLRLPTPDRGRGPGPRPGKWAPRWRRPPGPFEPPRRGAGSAWRSSSPVGGERVRLAPHRPNPAASERCWGLKRPRVRSERCGATLRGKGRVVGSRRPGSSRSGGLPADCKKEPAWGCALEVGWVCSPAPTLVGPPQAPSRSDNRLRGS